MKTFKEFEYEAWQQKACRYANTWGRVSNQVIEPLLGVATLKEGVKFLDCGSGTGQLCSAAARTGADVLGCDNSPEMVRIASETFPNLRFDVEDAEDLSYADGKFDVVSLNYVLLHLAHQEQALLEARRVLKFGGKLIFSIWLPPAESAGIRLMFNAVKKFADLSVIPPAQDIFLFADRAHSSEFLLSNGFTNVQFLRVETYWDVEDADEFFDAVQAGTRIGGTIDLQSPEVKEKIRADILEHIDEYRRDQRYIIPTPSLIVSADKAA